MTSVRVLDDGASPVRVSHHAWPVCPPLSCAGRPGIVLHLQRPRRRRRPVSRASRSAQQFFGGRLVQLEQNAGRIIWTGPSGTRRAETDRGKRRDAEVDHINPTCGDEESTSGTDRGGLAGGAAGVLLHHDGQGCSISQASAGVLWGNSTARRWPTRLAAVDEFLTPAAVRHEWLYTAGKEVLGRCRGLPVGLQKYPAQVKVCVVGMDGLEGRGGRAPNRQRQNRLTRDDDRHVGR